MKNNNLNNVINAVKAVHKNDKVVLSTLISSIFISAVIPYISILLSSYILDGLATKVAVKELVTTTLIVLAVIFLLNMIQSYIDNIGQVHMDICRRNFDMELSKRTLTMDYQLLDSPLVNDIKNKIQHDNNWGSGFYSMFHTLPYVIHSVFGLISAFFLILPLFTQEKFFNSYFNVIFLISITLIVLVISFVNIKVFMKREYAIMDETSNFVIYSSGFIYGGFNYKHGKDMRIYNALDLMKSKCKIGKEWSEDRVKRMSQVSGIQGFLDSFSSRLLQGGSYFVIVLAAIAGDMTVGSVVRYAAAISNFINNIIGLYASWNTLCVTARRQQGKLEYINVLDVMQKGTIPVEKRSDNEYEIEFRNVSFKYPGSENYVLKNLSMKLKVGNHMAVVGMNGSGKTTMIKLLCRLYDPTEGEILLNGFNIKKYDYNEYMNIFSVVFQDFSLFSFSLGQNVATSVDYDTDKVLDCLHTAGFSDRYTSLPKGLKTPLYSDYEDGGVEISGGEAQKIAIARALYKNAPFIILDEPTAALDPVAEYEIYSKFNEIVTDKTAIYISHRLSSCRFCNDIVVFDNGEMIQRGNHDTLIFDKNGKYHELWNAQAQYYVANING